ncbi:T9SS type A sorting domain-containing protein [uncultured Kordia sp.]|uniref:T9SS type A sorting domain-containing protein n=1 Tax=uncultured Kordia sp. TaxID=507699 RepID=UPI0026117913|nr:T9SS type A sorting domain-containing protein [uncultured Kordia sp.]
MKTTYKIQVVIFLLLFQVSFGQNTSKEGRENPNEPYQFILGENNFTDIKKEGLEFYKKKIETYGIERVATEGSPYIDFMRFISDWEIKLASYDYSLKRYFSSLDSKSDIKDLPVKGCEWEEFGPVVKSSGSQSNPTTGTETRLNGIGHTEFIRIDMNDPLSMLVGSTFGGLFYSSNGGELWTCVSDNWDTSAVAWAEFSEAYPGTIVAVSTLGGDLNGKSHRLGVDGAILISRDYGQTWRKLLSAEIVSYGKINKVIFNPDNPDEIFIAKSKGLYKYTDINDPNNPNNLEEVFIPSSPNGFSMIECLDVEIVKSDELFPDGNFFATSFQIIENFGSASVSSVKTYVTQNGWQTSQEVFSSIEKEAATFEFSPSNLSSAADPYKAKIHCNIKTSNLKQVWSLRLFNLSEDMLQSESEGSSNFGACFAFAVNPFDDKKIIYSFQLGLSGTNNGFVNNIGKPTNSGLHDDKEHFLWHPHPQHQNEVWVAHHGGISKSVDNGVTWESKDLGLGVGMVQKFDHSENDLNKILLSLDHDGTTRLNSSYNQPNLTHDWNMFSGISDGVGATIIDEDEYQFYFASGQTGTTDFVSANYYAPSVDLDFPSAYSTNYNGWYEPAQDGTVLYTHGVENNVNFGNVYKTELIPGVIPTTRTKISNFSQFLPNGNDLVLTQLSASQKNDNVLFANGVEFTPNGGNQVLFYCNKANDSDPQVAMNSWVEIKMPYDTGQPIINTAFGSVKESHYIDDRYYFTTSGNTDASYSEYRAVMLDINSQGDMIYTDITGNLPKCGVKHANDYNIAIEKGTHEGIYVVQDCGVYYLHGSDLDAGNYNWTIVGTGLPNIEKRGIKPYYTLNKLRVGTFGRGLWEGCFVCPEDEIFYESGTYGNSYVFKEARRQIHSTATIQVEQNVKYRAGDFIDLNPDFIAQNGSVFDAFIHPCEPNRSNSFKDEPISPWENLVYNSDESKSRTLEAASESLSLFPNPAKDITTIYLENFDGQYQVEIINFQGQKIETFEMKAPKLELDVSNLSKGVYLIKVSNGVHTHTVKLLKK